MNKIFQIAGKSNMATRSSFLKLVHPFRRTNMGQNNLSFIGPKEWNKLPMNLKLFNLIDTFKHQLKRLFLSSSKLKETNYS